MTTEHNGWDGVMAVYHFKVILLYVNDILLFERRID